MDVQIGPRTEMTEDRSDQGPKWMHTALCIDISYELFPSHFTFDYDNAMSIIT